MRNVKAGKAFGLSMIGLAALMLGLFGVFTATGESDNMAGRLDVPAQPLDQEPDEPPVGGSAERIPEPFQHVGAVVFDRQRGAVVESTGADTEFTSASIVKLLIALEAVDNGTDVQTVHDMLAHSDDIASQLWVDNGGSQLVSQWTTRIGLENMRPPADAGRWGDTPVTASDIVRIYRYLLDEAPARLSKPVLAALRDASPQGADGFDQYFGIPNAVPHSEPFAVKQGWSCCNPSRILHTTGLLGTRSRYIVAVLTEQPVNVDWASARRNITKFTRTTLQDADALS